MPLFKIPGLKTEESDALPVSEMLWYLIISSHAVILYMLFWLIVGP